MEERSRLIVRNAQRTQTIVRSHAMRSLARDLGVLAAIGVAWILAAPENAHAGGLPIISGTGKVTLLEARASRAYSQRRRRARRDRVKEEPPARVPQASELALPKRNPRRLGARSETANAKRAPAKGEIAKSETVESTPPPAPPAPPPAPPPWTHEEVLESRERCLVTLARIVVEIEPAPPMRTGQCGTSSPVMLSSIGSGQQRVTIRPPAMLNCDMVQAVYDWVEQTVQPAARAILGEDIVRLESVAGYQCRNRAGTTRLSEHGLANAIDILGFTTRSGHTISVLDEWGPTLRDFANSTAGAPDPAASESAARTGPPLPLPHPKRTEKLKPITARAVLRPNRPALPPPRAPSVPTELFLKRVHERSCEVFKTVLGPEANEDHRNHFHLDLAQRRHGGHYCR